MNFSQLLKSIPAPWDIAKNTFNAPFESRPGHPWAQSTARNLGHAAFGDQVGNYVDQHVLGDLPNGQTSMISSGGALPIPEMQSTGQPTPQQIFEQILRAKMQQGQQ